MQGTHSSRRRIFIASGIGALLAAAAGAILFTGLLSAPHVSIVFLGRDGQEIGRRGMPAASQAAHSPDYFLDWADGEVRRLMQGRDEKELVALTTLDRGMQEAAEHSIESALAGPDRDTKASQAALVSLEIPDGAVRAMAGGRDYRKSRLNYAAQAKRQPGSSFMPYVYLTALEGGAKPDQTVTDGPVRCGDWQPDNFGHGYRGAMTLSDALAKSINTVAVRLSLDNAYGGRAKVLANLQKMGIGGVRVTCSLALGDQGITLLEQTGAYLHFANGGKSAKPYAIVELRNAHGEVIYAHDRDEAPPQQIFERGAIENLNRMLQKVVTGNAGTGRLAALDFTPAAGKTGTSSGPRDASFIGFTGLYVTGVWFGNGDFSTMPGNPTGGHVAAPVWQDFNTAAHRGKTIPPIPGLDAQPAGGH